MNDILNNIESYMEKASLHDTEILISTIDGITLVHNFNAEKDMDELSSIASAMCSFSKKTTAASNNDGLFDTTDSLDQPIIEIDLGNSHYLISPILKDFILLIKANTQADVRLLIQESKQAIAAAGNILWKNYASGLPISQQNFFDTNALSEPMLQ